jgi:hypothetical protein
MRISLFAKHPQIERKKSMTSRLETEIKHTTGNHYIFFDSEEKDELTKKLTPNTPEYFTWVSGLKSFHFSGKNGHFTARKEARKNKDGSTREGAYWSAYKKANKKQFRKYLGKTDKLDIKTLENAAQHLTTVTEQQPKVKTERRRPEKRETLYARVKLREETIEQRNQRIAELEQKITSQEQEIKELKASIRHLKTVQKTKRESMEL